MSLYEITKQKAENSKNIQNFYFSFYSGIYQVIQIGSLISLSYNLRQENSSLYILGHKLLKYSCLNFFHIIKGECKITSPFLICLAPYCTGGRHPVRIFDMLQHRKYDWQKCKILNLGRRRDGNELKFCNLRQKEKPWNH